MARTGRQLGKTERLQLAADRGLVHRDGELLEDPLHEILASPAHDTVDRRDRAGVDDLRQGLPLCLVQFERTAGRLPVDEPCRATVVEPQHPVTHDLERYAADVNRLRSMTPAKTLLTYSKICENRDRGGVTIGADRDPTQK